MATWITHLRVADTILEKIKVIDCSLYFAGTIAPDTDMSLDISHWCSNGDKTTCDVDKFYRLYILNNVDPSTKEFYIGYYVHLLTDILWHEQKIKPLCKQDEQVIALVKEKWKNVDADFLTNQRNFRLLTYMNDSQKYLQKWFEYYSMEQVTELVEYLLDYTIIKLNKSSCVDIVVKNEIEQFIQNSCGIILHKLKEIGI